MYYKDLVLSLEDDRLYSASTIAQLAFEGEGINFKKARKPTRVNLRHSLCLLARQADFPREGDGLVFQRGVAAASAWYGKRWKQACRDHQARKQQKP